MSQGVKCTLGLGGGSSVEMRFFFILIGPFQALFTGFFMERFLIVELSSHEFSKNGKILYILGIFKFSIGNLGTTLIFGPDQFLGP